MAESAVFIREHALAACPQSGRSRELIIAFVRGLAVDPFHRGDFAERDAVGRELEVKVVGRHAITYYADHAAKEVKVLKIQPADR